MMEHKIEKETPLQALLASDPALGLPEENFTGIMQQYTVDGHGQAYEIDEANQLETLESFAKEFKQKRIKLGFTQGDVGIAIGKLCNNDFSQTTISRFEALNLSFKNMCKLRPLLEMWLNYARRIVEHANDDGADTGVLPFASYLEPDSNHSRKRKKRTSIDQTRTKLLNEIFTKNPKPTSDDLHSIAEQCKLEREVIRVWFCNRRQKEKRIQTHEQQALEENPSDSFTANVVPSSDTDFSSVTPVHPHGSIVLPQPLGGGATSVTSNSLEGHTVSRKKKKLQEGKAKLLHSQSGEVQKVYARANYFLPSSEYP